MISIHALREEGDQQVAGRRRGRKNFYPRPPRGGRRHSSRTPNSRQMISIHALREEGDTVLFSTYVSVYQFLSTPSARRATFFDSSDNISGSNFYPRPPRGGRLHRTDHRSHDRGISIHALREEGDYRLHRSCRVWLDFYPRPPRGGRQRDVCKRYPDG